MLSSSRTTTTGSTTKFIRSLSKALLSWRGLLGFTHASRGLEIYDANGMSLDRGKVSSRSKLNEHFYRDGTALASLQRLLLEKSREHQTSPCPVDDGFMSLSLRMTVRAADLVIFNLLVYINRLFRPVRMAFIDAFSKRRLRRAIFIA